MDLNLTWLCGGGGGGGEHLCLANLELYLYSVLVSANSYLCYLVVLVASQ